MKIRQNMSMQQEIADWNGKSTDDIQLIYSHYYHKPSFVSEILLLIKQVLYQKGATWLLKKYLEDEGHLTHQEMGSVYRSLPELEFWEAKLHILQCMPLIPIQKSKVKAVESFLRDCLADQNKFVRAWAYNGFYLLANQYPEYQSEIDQLLDQAMRNEAASVKARIRNILKQS